MRRGFILILDSWSALTPAQERERDVACLKTRKPFVADLALENSLHNDRMRDVQPIATNAADFSPSPGGEGRGEGGPIII